MSVIHMSVINVLIIVNINFNLNVSNICVLLMN